MRPFVEINEQKLLSVSIDHLGGTPSDYMRDVDEGKEQSEELFEQIQSEGFSRLTHEPTDTTVKLVLPYYHEEIFESFGVIAQMSVGHELGHPPLNAFLEYLNTQNASTRCLDLALYV